MPTADTPKIPAGWTWEPSSERFILSRPDGYRVTIDFEARVFRAGVTHSGRATGPKTPLSGRGWEQALVTAAVRWLEVL